MATTAQVHIPIRVGIGGWSYDAWHGSFYPAGLPQSRELEHASRQLGVIEINATFYSSFKPATFAKWRDQTPEAFVFSVKASRYATHHRVLADAGPSVERFIGSGIAELGPKLGPVLWQFPPTKRFEPEDFEAFLGLLPARIDGCSLRHVLDVRHPSFMSAGFLDLARRYKATTVFADTDEYPSFADLTGDLVYARLMRSHAELQTGYAPQALDRWAERAREWARGGEPVDLPRIGDPAEPGPPRDVFMFFISGAKERAPAAAMELIRRLG